jgi:hypothetical protein
MAPLGRSGGEAHAIRWPGPSKDLSSQVYRIIAGRPHGHRLAAAMVQINDIVDHLARQIEKSVRSRQGIPKASKTVKEKIEPQSHRGVEKTQRA